MGHFEGVSQDLEIFLISVQTPQKRKCLSETIHVLA